MNERQRNPSNGSISKKTTSLASSASNDHVGSQSILTSSTSVSLTSSPNNQPNTGNVKVVCRFRPLNQREISLGNGYCVEFVDMQNLIHKTTQHSEMGPAIQKFQFDHVFDMRSTQDEVYNCAAKPIVESILEGFNGTIFAYGQTASGKTYTMQGPSIDDPELKGIVPRTVKNVFEAISTTPDHIEFTVKVSMVEIYMEKIRDLISPEKINLKLREDKVRGIYIEDVTESYVSEEKEIYDLMLLGNSNRATSATNMNVGSSRSHLIFTMSIQQNNLHEMSAKTGKLFLVDLAGSEKISKSGAEGRSLEEAKKINLGLSSLGNVINSLTDGKSHHIPYRNSKLTRVLQESLGGNSRTALIITCSPSIIHDQETLSTLRFGFRAKSIKNTPKINRQFTVNELQLLLEKAEKTIEEQDKKIKILENLLINNGYQLPKLDETFFIPNDEPKEAEQRIEVLNDDGSGSDEDTGFIKKKLNSMRTIMNNDDPTRIKLLEQELEQEKNSVRIQTEKLNVLKQEYAYLNGKNLTIEKENEDLMDKLSTLTIKVEEMDEYIKEKDKKLDELSSLYQSRCSLMEEIDNLKKNKENLMKTIDEKNYEIEKYQVTLKNHHKTASINDCLTANMSKIFANNYGNVNIDTPIREIYKLLNERLELIDDKMLRKSIQDLFNKLASIIQNNRPASPYTIREKNMENKELAELRMEIQLLRKELFKEQEKNMKLQYEYDKLMRNYEQLARTNIPKFEDIKQRLLEEAISKERTKHERDKAMMYKDFQNKMDKWAKLEIQLFEEREKNKILESKLMENDKGLKSKLNQKKFEFKAERVINLEKQLNETKDLVGQYKEKIESLKALISVSNSNTSSIQESLHESADESNLKPLNTSRSRKDGSLEDNSLIYQNRKISAQNSSNGRIVKPIRGGKNKKRTFEIANMLNFQVPDINDIREHIKSVLN